MLARLLWTKKWTKSYQQCFFFYHFKQPINIFKSVWRHNLACTQISESTPQNRITRHYISACQLYCWGNSSDLHLSTLVSVHIGWIFYCKCNTARFVPPWQQTCKATQEDVFHDSYQMCCVKGQNQTEVAWMRCASVLFSFLVRNIALDKSQSRVCYYIIVLHEQHINSYESLVVSSIRMI